MEPVAIASAAMAGQQAQLGAAAAQKIMKMNHEAATAMVEMLAQASAASAGSATAPGVGARIDRQA